MSHKLISAFVAIACAGPTVDGREITETQIEQMAANYDPATYGARIFNEHYRGLLVDSAFPAMGDVTELKAEKNADGKLTLYARLAPNDHLLQANRMGQKVYSSIEMDPSFADTNEAYLVGLAVTDNPASLGTDRLSFSQKAKADSGKDSILSRTVESGTLDFAAPQETASQQNGPSIVERIKKVFGAQTADTSARLDQVEAGMVAMAEGVDAMGAGLQDSISKLSNAANSGTAATATQLPANTPNPDDEVTALKAKVAELTSKLSNEPDPSADVRPPSTGADTFAKTDC